MEGHTKCCESVGREQIDRQPMGNREESIFTALCLQLVLSQILKNLLFCLHVCKTLQFNSVKNHTCSYESNNFLEQMYAEIQIKSGL